ncbi:Transposon Ty3-G Gag-Pol polyprotein [Hypsizygus marmoreus]|uniref:RNA-directed DNA polymerase n=2 Tax=Hypsizygus marmoreus TaxID=39966 RepID=A0A369J7F7_HYPMA|nr:Transposon Ty3-G Gag-Pol polyprotein [Hypsizygus marmoreus]
MTSQYTPTVAIASQLAPSHAPILSPGVITYDNFKVFEKMCQRFFSHKSIAPNEQVQRIIYNFEDTSVQDWLDADFDKFVALTFPNFATEFMKKWLPLYWEDDILMRVIRMQDNRPFWPWVIDIKKCNLLLVGKPLHVAVGTMKAHLTTRFDPPLRAVYRSADNFETMETMTVFDNWVDEVRKIDDRIRAHSERNGKAYIDKLVAQSVAARIPLSSNISNTLPAPPHQSTPTPSTSSNTSRPPRPFIPRLSDAEKSLLASNGGCYKCRLFYTGHYADSCTVERPSPEAIRNVTPENAALAKTAYEQRKPAVVAAVFGTEPATFVSDNYSYDDSPMDEDYYPEYAADEYVPSFTDSLPKHVWWDCSLDAPFTCAPTPVRVLIDSGACPVMIFSEMAEIHSLVPRRLHKPFLVSGAFSSSSTPGDTSSLSTYCKLHLQSRDARWKSRVVHAIIVPNLVTDIILGLDFLIRNKLVLDPASRTLIAKECGFDLLNPPDASLFRTPIVRSPPQIQKADAALARAEAEQIRTARKTWRPVCIAVHAELLLLFKKHPARFDFQTHTTGSHNIIAVVRARIEHLASLDTLRELDHELKTSFSDCFPTDIPHVRDLPTEVYHNIEVPPNTHFSTARAYSCPRKYRAGWKTLIDQHVAAGRIRPSCSPFTSPSFIVPKADPNILPRWVNDFRGLNKVTTLDNYPLPRIDDILADCAKGSIWGKIDMTNSFFQTLMNPDHIKYTATLTPFGLWEWVVMPMGLRNSPATHQRRVTLALKDHIGKICHVYLDDIIIWSSSVEEHKVNVSLVLEALRAANLFCSLKKSILFTTEIDFLGHHISPRGIEADASKVERILNWPRPRSAKDVRRFLGLVRYIATFLPALAEFTSILTPLTRKECNTFFPGWSPTHQNAFDQIKSLIVSRECLTTINHDNPGANKIYVTCDASLRRTGAVLSFGESWEAARPVAFESRQLRGPELHYPVHEQEMLSIMRAITKWRSDLLGTHIHIYTDHKTLENFDTQRDLSRRQARWMEYLSQYEYTIHYIAGELNTVADALSRLPDSCDPHPSSSPVTAVFEIRSDPTFVSDIKSGYTSDPWCKSLITDMEKNLIDEKLGIQLSNGLLFVGSRLVIPRFKDLRENLFRLAHDNLGHFGGNKSYLSLRDDFYWPNMRRDLVRAYVPSCVECQRNKSCTTKPPGPLHPLPVPDKRFDSVAIDFVGPLPKDDGFDEIVTITDRLGTDIQIVPCSSSQSAEQFATLFFNNWVCENGMPSDIVTDRDKLFVSKFWKALMKLSGIQHRLSTAYHPETDGASERSNKTVIQCLRFHVERNQTGWVRSLPKVRFDIMNSINNSIGLSGFMLKSGHSPRLIPPLLTPLDIPAIIVTPPDEDALSPESHAATSFMDQLHVDFLDAQDSLTAAKISQAHQANVNRSADHHFAVGDKVLLATAHRRHDYMQAKDGRVAKFMPRFDGPFSITKAFPNSSLYTLALPENSKIHPTFHSSQLRPFVENDDTMFPHRILPRPGPIVTNSGSTEYFIERILDERKRGRGKQFLVRWLGYGAESDLWLAGSELANTEALDNWEKLMALRTPPSS